MKTLTGRFLILTIGFVMLAEVLIFVPSVARFREEYLVSRLERAQIASLALLTGDVLAPELEAELLENAEVYNVVLVRDQMRQLALASPIPEPVSRTYDLRDATVFELIWGAGRALLNPDGRVIRVIGQPVREGGELIEVTLPSAPLRAAMIEYGIRILGLSAVISVVTSILLFLAVRRIMVAPIRRVVSAMQSYATAPEDTRRIISPSATVTELRTAEEALQGLQTQLTASLRQKDRLAQLGSAVAKISHDLRNVLTTAQLFDDRIEGSTDPVVARMAPKLLNSISRAIAICEATLTFGKAEEPPPTLGRVKLADLVSDVIDGERLASGESEISFAEDVPTAMTLRADPEQLYRVIGNLVRNARQALVSAGGGEIAVSADETGDDWFIRVTDTGPGLPKRAQEHLFQPFQSASKSGTGLGLTIADDLVRGHGGDLKLIDTGAHGTTFQIRLPKGLVCPPVDPIATDRV